MIKVSGTYKMAGTYEVRLNMTEKQFDALGYQAQRDLLDSHIDWLEANRSAELDDIDVDDLEEVEEEK